jgi:hypothetical protein
MIDQLERRAVMKRIAILLMLCFMETAGVNAQADRSGPPDQMWLCTAPEKCVLLQIDRKTYVDLGGYGTDPTWRYNLDAWEPGFIALTGASYRTHFDGRRQVAVITAVRDPRSGKCLVHGVEHVILGGKDTVRKITLKWDKERQGGEATAKLGNPVVPDYF